MRMLRRPFSVDGSPSMMAVRGKADEKTDAGGDRQGDERAVLDFIGEPPQRVVPELRRFVAELDGLTADRAGPATKPIAELAQRRGDRVTDTVGRVHSGGGGPAADTLELLLERPQPALDFGEVRGNRARIS